MLSFVRQRGVPEVQRGHLQTAVASLYGFRVAAWEIFTCLNVGYAVCKAVQAAAGFNPLTTGWYRALTENGGT